MYSLRGPLRGKWGKNLIRGNSGGSLVRGTVTRMLLLPQYTHGSLNTIIGSIFNGEGVTFRPHPEVGRPRGDVKTPLRPGPAVKRLGQRNFLTGRVIGLYVNTTRGKNYRTAKMPFTSRHGCLKKSPIFAHSAPRVARKPYR